MQNWIVAFAVRQGKRGRELGPAAVLFSVLGLVACGDGTPNPLGGGGGGGAGRFADCRIETEFLVASVARDATPSLDNARWVSASERVPDYLDADTRVIGIVAGGRAWAIPHNVLWHHEIVNLDTGGPLGEQLAITYCPLTGSSLVFDREAVGGVTLGVSGLLFKNNLVLYDRRSPEESLWPQMQAAAACGPRAGIQLPQYPFVEMEWAEWLALHPATDVPAEDQGFEAGGEPFDYTRFGYPYGPYRSVDAPFSAAHPPMDRRLFAKERVVGAPSSATDRGIAFPSAAVTELEGPRQVIPFEYEGSEAVLLWSDEAQGGAMFQPMSTDGAAVTLVAASSDFEDLETRSRWTLDGRSVSGPMQGARLVPLDRSYTAFWFAWAAFHPDTRLWEG